MAEQTVERFRERGLHEESDRCHSGTAPPVRCAATTTRGSRHRTTLDYTNSHPLTGALTLLCSKWEKTGSEDATV
ncbi:MAG: hypothetical protein LVQ64_05035 [Thermoplasmatales archaeon]|nr:hypothetical protein [Thermoplasmatales archaeon]